MANGQVKREKGEESCRKKEKQGEAFSHSTPARNITGITGPISASKCRNQHKTEEKTQKVRKYDSWYNLFLTITMKWLYLMSSWKGLNRPPMVAQRGHFLRAPCSAMSTSTHVEHKPQMHSVQAYEFLSREILWQAAQ